MKSQGAPPRRSCHMAHLQARGHRQENCVFGETTGIQLHLKLQVTSARLERESHTTLVARISRLEVSWQVKLSVKC